MTRSHVLLGLGAALCVTQSLAASAECQAPTEPAEREVKVALRAGGRAGQRLDEEFERLKKKSTIRPSLPQDLVAGGYSEFMQEIMASWRDFMDYTPARDDQFEEGDRKARGKFTWKTRLRQLNTIMQYGLKKEEIMSLYGGYELYPAVAGTYWLRKLEFEALPLLSSEAALFTAIWQLVGPSRLQGAIRRCQAQAPCACHFVACRPIDGQGQLMALELRSRRFQWPKLEELPKTAATQVRYLALESIEGAGALKHPEFWLQAFPGIQVLQLSVPLSMELIGKVSALLQGWQDELLGLSLHWNPEFEIRIDDPVEAPVELLESICVLKKLRRLHVDGYIRRLPSCFGQLPLVELDVRGLQFRDASAVPPALAALGPTLRSFIAYSQGLDRSCQRAAPWNKTSPAFLSRCRPRPSWDAAEPMDSTEDDAWAWQCPWESWVVRLDDPEAPWWSWHQLERFWVDANFLHGHFPPALVEAWPRLRSLDLQLNELSGPLPGEALSKLQNLTALRIHRNNFSGQVPAAIFEAPSLHYINFEGNPELRGCIPRRELDEETWHVLLLQIQGTKITGLCEETTEQRTEL